MQLSFVNGPVWALGLLVSFPFAPFVSLAKVACFFSVFPLESARLRNLGPVNFALDGSFLRMSYCAPSGAWRRLGLSG